ncbi:hypothetical protein [Candidatus Clostridium stratigraminis]|uniref:DUF21 domain-containing protein n=1 Tax=Candidatus Clostridium stratigraminis TaxID=3381661 RepID=A0ABW8T2S2_9CLOT
MPTEFELINSENIAQLIFIASSLLGIESGITGKQALEEKQMGLLAQSQSTTIKAAEIVIDSNLLSICSYLIFLIAAIIRKNQVEKEILTGSSKVSVTPNIIIIASFTFSLVGTLLRFIIAKERLKEVQLPFSLL